MKKQLIKFRWLVYLLIMLCFSAGLYEWGKKEHEYQHWLRKHLGEHDLFISEEPVEWLESAPDFIKKLFNSKIRLEVYSESFCDEGEKLRVNQLRINEFCELKGVKSLELSLVGVESSLAEKQILDSLLLGVSEFSELEELSLSAETLTEEHFLSLNKLVNLKTLYLDILHFEPSYLHHLKGLNPKHLTLKTSNDFSDGDLSALELFTNLEELYVGHFGDFCGFRFDRNSSILEKIPALPNLRKLYGWGTLGKFDTSKFPKLNLVDCGLFSFDKKLVKELRANPDLIPLLKDYLLNVNTSDKDELMFLSKLTNCYELSFQDRRTDFSLIDFSKMDNLEYLTLPNGVAVDDIMKSVSMIKNLKSITVEGVRFTPSEYESLQAVGIQLREVYIDSAVPNWFDISYFSWTEIDLDYSYAEDDHFIELLDGSLKNRYSIWIEEDLQSVADKNRKCLDLSLNELTPGIIRALEAFESLEDLSLSCISGIIQLNSFKNKSGLKNLRIESYDLPAEPLTKFNSLISLDITNSSGKDFTISNFIQLKEIKNLKELIISSYDEHIDVSGIENLMLENLILHGEFISMNRCFINPDFDSVSLNGDADINVLSMIGSSKAVNVELYDMKIDDENLKEIIKCGRAVKQLDLYQCKLSSESILSLSKFPDLEDLTISLEVDEKVLVELLRKLPKLKDVAIAGNLSRAALAEKFPEIHFRYRH